MIFKMLDESVKRPLIFFWIPLLVLMLASASAMGTALAKAADGSSLADADSKISQFEKGQKGAEKSLYKEYKPKTFASLRDASLKSTAGLTTLALLSDFFLWILIGAGKISKLAPKSDASFKRHSTAGLLLSLAVILLIFGVIYIKFSLIPWKYIFTPQEFSYMPHKPDLAGLPAYLAYLHRDLGRPMVAFKIFLSIVFAAGSGAAFVRRSSLFFCAATALLTFFMARRNVKSPVLALLVPFIFLLSPGFDYALQDYRGYAFMAFFSFLSVCLYDGMRDRPSPGIFFLWFLSHVISISSYPATLTIAAALFAHFLLFQRKTLTLPLKRAMDLHFGFLLAAGLALAPISLATVGLKTHIHEEMPQIVSAYSAFDVYCAAGAVMLAIFLTLRKGSLKRPEGAFSLAALFGVGTTVFFFALNILPRFEKYLLFALPVFLVSLAIMAERLLESAPGRSKIAASAIAFAALALPGLFGIRDSLLLSAYFKQMEKSFSTVDSYVKDAEIRNWAAALYPDDYFNAYMSYKYGSDSPALTYRMASMLKQKLLPTGETLLFYEDNKEIFSSFPPLEKPSQKVGKPVRLIISNFNVLGARTSISNRKLFEKMTSDAFDGKFAECDAETELEKPHILIKACD